MLNERAYIAHLESADTEELVHMLARPTAEEEKALRVHLGDGRYQRMHGLALRRGVRRAVVGPRGNVVVIPGIMGSELTSVDRKGDLDRVWVQVLRIMTGRLDRLRLGDDGRSEYDRNHDVRATGILKRYYGELQLSLSENWNVRAFWFDWRKDLNIAADELKARISGWFADDAPIHIVAHSMGGLVARTFVKNHPERWKMMWDERSGGESGGRLVMLGTPNHGSFAIPQAITGMASIVKWLARLDAVHSHTGLLEILNSFVGSYQMLPSPLRMPGMEPLYDTKTYGDLNITQARLDNALRHHELLREGAVDAERMVYVAGYGQPTFSGIEDFSRLDNIDAYDVTMRGDGTVPHELGLLEGVKTYYVDEEHGNLTSNKKVLSALEELLGAGATAGLSDRLPAERRGPEDEATKEEARRQLTASQTINERRLQALRGRNSQRSAAPRSADYIISTDEREMEEILTRDFLCHEGREERPVGEKEAPFGPAAIEIGLVCGEIQNLPYGDVSSESGDPVDAISVGHYINVKPREAELALDQAISRALSSKAEESDGGPVDELPEADRLLTQYFERGTLHGQLGQMFFLPDPRPVSEGDGTVARVVTIAGMGLPGTFGVPELTVLAREICWSLGRMEKRHLATVLIGSEKGNIPARDAVSAWMRGIKNAITGSFEGEGRRLVRVTFVEKDPYKIEDIEKAILEEKRSLEERNRLKVGYRGPDKEELEGKKKKERQKRLGGSLDWRDREAADERVPTRITLRLEGNSYWFGAITEDASIPEREIPLDPDLVLSANDELAAEPDPLMQSERGRFLEKLLVPAELRGQLSTNAPLVMMLDSTLARIHWEMVAQPGLVPPSGIASGETEGANGGESPGFDPDRFFGTSRGFTRQLRTTFAPPPEPPPPPRRVMRVLVVADPAEGAYHLPGAEEEGIEVADLFETFNTVHEKSYNRVEVVRLFGPHEATRITVLRHLTLHSYDVLHFAGHCMYDVENPEASGWIFSGGKRISANELNRIDRVPKFVFSNACESGITPDRSGLRSDKLAPSFAETFFKRGITNFVCTAWPVDDAAALGFALTLYANLLGLSRVDARESLYEPIKPQPMHVAMREARLAIAEAPGGARTWGAYQHYGSPYFRFFDPETMQREKTALSKA